MSSLVFPSAILAAKLVSREPFTGVLVDEAASGKEARSSWQSTTRYRYRLAFDIVRTATRFDLQRLQGFFQRHFGQLDSFLFTDPADYSVTDHGFGVGDGSTTAFQLQRSQEGSVYETTGGPWATSSKPRTNLVLQSQTFDNASWTKDDASVSANAVIAPDGTATADKLVENSAASTFHDAVSATFTVSVAGVYTASVWVKPAGRTKVELYFTDVGLAEFNLSSGVVTSSDTGVTARITACVNGWYRCEITLAAVSTPSRLTIYMVDTTSEYTGDGASGVYLWGAQVEQAAAATQYIATTAATVKSTPAYWPTYSDGFEPIKYPNLGDLLIYKDGVLKTLTTDYTVSSTGLVTFAAAPAAAAVLSWSGTYYRRVRMAQAGLSMEWIGDGMYQVPTCELVSVT